MPRVSDNRDELAASQSLATYPILQNAVARPAEHYWEIHVPLTIGLGERISDGVSRQPNEAFSRPSGLVSAYEGTNSIPVSTLPCHRLWHRIPSYYIILPRYFDAIGRAVCVKVLRGIGLSADAVLTLLQHRKWTLLLIGFKGY